MTINIIGLVGRKRSGKSTLAKAIAAKYAPRVLLHSLGGRVKRLVEEAFPNMPHQITYGDDRELNVLQPLYVDRTLDRTNDSMACTPINGRQLQVNIAQAARIALGPDVWIKPVMEEIAKSPKCLHVIDDVRQPNEAEAIRNAGGILIRVNKTPIDLHEFTGNQGIRCKYIFTGGEVCCMPAHRHPCSWTPDMNETEWALPETSGIYHHVIAGDLKSVVAQGIAIVDQHIFKWGI